MRSREFTVESIPPPLPPQSLSICELSTPEYQKLTSSIVDSTVVAVRWPWTIEADDFAKSRYNLEYTTDVRPSPCETFATRAHGPWHVPSTNLFFVRFETGEVLSEWPGGGDWTPVLVASLVTEGKALRHSVLSNRGLLSLATSFDCAS